ncbi:PCI domain-containing protein [Mycena indigotica]|uniref:PCI domain-containing protein n=1 Tax=Mycena indigotica TaxID=2126181 RepID=A0A8H6WI78_9AGAR|nr:PCI domain-containing protein [Mycena indigotica]KAF7315843.1 PCI domain-containing protein [Mycena indigotica]
MATKVASLLANSLELFVERGQNLLEEVRTRLEWSWGLEYEGLEEHLQQFPDNCELLTDEQLIVLPHRYNLWKLSIRASAASKSLQRRPHISQTYKGTSSFNYFVIPLDPASPVMPRRIQLTTPPHIIVIYAAAKLSRAYHGEPIRDDPIGRELLERVLQFDEEDPFQFDNFSIGVTRQLYRTWTNRDPVAPTFKSGQSDATLVEERPVIHVPSAENLKSKQPPTVEVYLEPERRVTAHELMHDFNGEEGSSDSDIEDDSDPLWEMDVEQWASTALHVGERDEKVLINEVLPDALERTRTFASIDLSQPAYLKHGKRRRAAV